MYYAKSIRPTLPKNFHMGAHGLVTLSNYSVVIISMLTLANTCKLDYFVTRIKAVCILNKKLILFIIDQTKKISLKKIIAGFTSINCVWTFVIQKSNIVEYS